MDTRGRTDEEDKFLETLVDPELELNWEQISESLKKRNFHKTSKQCRERYPHPSRVRRPIWPTNFRWINKLNPKISKQMWTDKDGERLFGLHKIHGSSWKTISNQFKGRTDNFLKNQFFSLIRRSLRRLTRFLDIPKGQSGPEERLMD